MPGCSLAGKTTLVRAFLEEGATYYSDEYAVLDAAGRVNPYPRPLAVRCEIPPRTQLVPAEAFGARTGIEALPVHFVLVTSYCPGSRWRPRHLSQAQALLRLMANTVAAQGSPAHSACMVNARNIVARSLLLPTISDPTESVYLHFAGCDGATSTSYRTTGSQCSRRLSCRQPGGSIASSCGDAIRVAVSRSLVLKARWTPYPTK